MNCSERKKVKIFGVPVDLGSAPLGVEMGPTAIRYAGLIDALQFNDIEYIDHGDLKVDREACENGYIEEIARVSEELAGLVDMICALRYRATHIIPQIQDEPSEIWSIAVINS